MPTKIQKPAAKIAKRRRSSASHQAILTAASELLCECGYAAVTIDQIAARAGVGKQTIYRWWQTKIQIYIELYDGMARSFVKPFEGNSLEEEVTRYAKTLVQLLKQPVALLAFRGMIAEAQLSEASRIHFHNYMDERFEVTRGILRRAILRGEIHPAVNLESLHSLLGGAVVWQVLLGGQRIKPKFVGQLSKTVLQGLRSVSKSLSPE